MMRTLARVAERWWWAVILAWAAATGLLVAVGPSFAEVATFDETSFLPADSQAIVGARALRETFDDQFVNALAVAVVREDGELTVDDRAHARELSRWLRSDAAPATVGDVASPLDDPALEDALTSRDGQVLILLAGLEAPAFTPEANAAVETIREHLAAAPAPDGLDVHVTGSPAVAADQAAAIETSVARTHLITLLLVILVLLWVYRSPIAPLVPLATIAVAHTVAIGVVSLLASAGMDVSSLFQTFSIVIVFGAGTDYCLFLVSRFHEELTLAHEVGHPRTQRTRRRTLVATTTVLGAVLASSAATVAVGFSAQAVADFGLYRTMGPAMAIAIVVTLLASLTLTPALMRAFGRILFWPDRGARGSHGATDPLIGPVEVEDRAPVEVGG